MSTMYGWCAAPRTPARCAATSHPPICLCSPWLCRQQSAWPPRHDGRSEAELREWGRNILENLHHWLIDAREAEVAARYEAQGQLRFEEEVPLHECVRGVCVLKEKVLEFVQEQAQDKNFMNLYAEEELEHRLGRFFDLTICHLVRGYEVAMRKACRMAAVV